MADGGEENPGALALASRWVRVLVLARMTLGRMAILLFRAVFQAPSLPKFVHMDELEGAST
jgi:hypothetical protein